MAAGATGPTNLRVVRDQAVASASTTPVAQNELWPCTSPLHIAGLTFGTYTFTVSHRMRQTDRLWLWRQCNAN